LRDSIRDCKVSEASQVLLRNRGLSDRLWNSVQDSSLDIPDLDFQKAYLKAV